MLHPSLLRHLNEYAGQDPGIHERLAPLWAAISRQFNESEREKIILESTVSTLEQDFDVTKEKLLRLENSLDTALAQKMGEKNMLAGILLDDPSPVFRINAAGDIEFCNQPASTLSLIDYQDKRYGVTDFFREILAEINDSVGSLELQSGQRSFLFYYKKVTDTGTVNFYGIDITEQKEFQQKAYDNFYRLNNFLESTEAVYYIVYKNHKEKSFFTSRWPLFFGFNPSKVDHPLEEKRGSVLLGSVTDYDEAIRQLEFSGHVHIKYQVENRVTYKKMWLQEEIHKKYDHFLNDEVLTGRIMDISSTEFYKEHLAETEKRFKRITDSLPVMVWVSDRNDNITYTNDKARDFFGFFVENLSSDTRFDTLIHPDYSKAELDKWHEGLHNRMPVEGEFMIRGKSGKYHYMRQVAVPRFLESGEFIGYIGAFFDLTNEYEYNQMLEADKKQFELISMNSSDVTVITDWQGVISYISPAVKRLLGYTEREVIGKNLQDFVAEKNREQIKPIFSKSGISSYEIRNFTFQMIKKSGTPFWVETAISMISSQSIEGQNILLHIRDINEQHIAYDTLKASELKYRGLFENMKLGVMEVDNDENILYVNPAFEMIVGYRRSEMLGQNAVELFEPDKDNTRKLQTHTRIRKRGRDSAYELEVRRKNGTNALLVISGAPMFDLDGKVRGSIGIHWDVTEIREMEKRLLEEGLNKEKELFEARLQAEEDQRALIGRDLHDGVGQMLAYVNLYLGLIREKKVYSEAEIMQVEKVVQQTLEQVRTLSRTLTPPAIRDLGLRDSVIELIGSYGILQKPKFKMCLYPQADDEKISIDKKIVVFRVLQELLNNSFKYAESSLIQVDIKISDKHLRMVYADDGQGFDLKKAKKGVGLKSMKSRITFYKGSVNLDSAPGKGMSATIQIPV